jgi:hypothetical protein
MNGAPVPPLRELSGPLRIGLTGVLLVLLGGLAASVAHLAGHHENRDGRPGVSLDDLEAAYHGLDRPAPLLTRLADGTYPELPDEERRVLLTWLESDRISEGYDDLDLGDAAPAEILDRRCLSCHARRAVDGEGIGQRVPLEYWDDVERVAFSLRVEPVPTEILVVSTHTHALSLAAITLAVGLLLLATRWPRPLRHGLCLIGGLALAVDVACWWLARASAAAVPLLTAAGALYVCAMVLASLAVLFELWLPAARGEGERNAGDSRRMRGR